MTTASALLMANNAVAVVVTLALPTRKAAYSSCVPAAASRRCWHSRPCSIGNSNNSSRPFSQLACQHQQQ
uniref:Putative secreted peptide n=1 Tax=Anopheles braziliensis TaxID=58242 RepID=A0A2M3ZUC5_9DIPT